MFLCSVSLFQITNKRINQTDQELADFAVKGQIVNIPYVDHMSLSQRLNSAACSVAASIGNMKTHEPFCVPIKFY